VATCEVDGSSTFLWLALVQGRGLSGRQQYRRAAALSKSEGELLWCCQACCTFVDDPCLGLGCLGELHGPQVPVASRVRSRLATASPGEAGTTKLHGRRWLLQQYESGFCVARWDSAGGNGFMCVHYKFSDA
jgi:hypothetical protein